MGRAQEVKPHQRTVQLPARASFIPISPPPHLHLARISPLYLAGLPMTRPNLRLT